ncbi:MAG: alkyl sulfatase dimerization domain-containing protein [Acidimicrobiales bacterium]
MDDATPERKLASDSTKELHRTVLESLASASGSDFERATRGMIAPGAPRQVPGRLGQVLWDLDAYAFLDDPETVTPPSTVNPSLWRQGRLNNIAGLFEVTPSIFQVRGMDISNVTFISGTTGWIVIDPLTSEETARAALALVNEHLGARPVRAVIYTHSHTDHFGGVHGVVSDDDVAQGRAVVIAPHGFLDAAISENVLAGTVMIRRAMYMYGVLLPKDAQGHVDTGLGKGMPALPSVALIAPTYEVTATGEELTVDGVRLVFQITPGTEAPAEMNIFVPDERALCMAENCTANQHNVYTLRGAQVRDALMWSKYIDESLALYAHECDVLFASHHWPRWGQADLSAYLASQRDAYRYVHDQTLRLANQGLTMEEIAEELVLPSGLGDEFFNRGYYGTLSHNAKAVYQRYLGWFDGNPAHLNPHPPVEAAKRYVTYMGGADAVLDRARDSLADGDYRWVVEVVNHVIFADPTNEAARLLQADALEQLGFQSESGPWRDFYLSGAMELRSNGTVLKGVAGNALGSGIVRSMTPGLLLDLIGVRLNGPRCAEFALEVELVLSDRGDERWNFGVRNGVLHARRDSTTMCTVAVVSSIAAFAVFATGSKSFDELLARDDFAVTGDVAGLRTLADALDVFEFGFEIVLP